MPIRDRKFYITKYNDYMTMKNNAAQKAANSGGVDIDTFTDMSQNGGGM